MFFKVTNAPFKSFRESIFSLDEIQIELARVKF